SAHCARPMTELSPAGPNSSTRKRRLYSKPTEEKSISYQLFLVGNKTAAERETSQARAFSQRAALAGGAKQRGLMRLLRSVQSLGKDGTAFSTCESLPYAPSFIMFGADPIRRCLFMFADEASTKSLIGQTLASVNRSLRTCTLPGVECRKFSRREAPHA